MKMTRLLSLPVAAVAISAVVAACASADDSADGPDQGARITIQNYAFTSPVTVAPGAKVTVTNRDSVDHNIIADDAHSFATPEILQGKSVTFTAPTRPGTYTFSCTFHPQMRNIGTLIVTG